jgi:hypothetical protein
MKRAVDGEGNLWVERYPPLGEESAEWSIFDREGAWLSDLNVEVVRLYKLIRA